MRTTVLKAALAFLVALPLVGPAVALAQLPRARLGEPVAMLPETTVPQLEKPVIRAASQEPLPAPVPVAPAANGGLATDSFMGDVWHQVGGYLGQVPWDAGRGRVWTSGEALLWWTRSSNLPPLVTTSLPGTTLANAGVLGVKTTNTLLGNNSIDYGPTSGARFGVGTWLNDGHTISAEADGFFLVRQSRDFVNGSNAAGSPILARPFISTLTGKETSEVVAFPGALSGTIAVASSVDLWGTEAIVLGHVLLDDGYRIQLLTGFRYVNLGEDLTVSQSSTALAAGTLGFNGTALAKGTTLGVLDAILTRNQFYGGEVGVRCSLPFGKVSLDWGGTMALGATHEVVNIGGSTTLTTPASSTTVPGGLLALPTNSGQHTHNAFGAIVEGQLKFKYHLTEHLHLGFGYDVLWWNEVARPGSQIDRTVDPRQVPSSLLFQPGTVTTRPNFFLNHGDFWVHGFLFEVGLTF